jgi:hypothetical protein
MHNLATITLCNRYAKRQSWFPYCVETWKTNLLPTADRFFVSDGSLDELQQREIENISGCKFFNTTEFDGKIDQILNTYPAIAQQREQCIFYRRIIDFSVYMANYEKVLSLDSDIGLLRPVDLPQKLPDFAFCVDEVPGYSAVPSVVFKSKILTGLNAGFLLFSPKVILDNLDFIESVTEKFISGGKIPWWSEQTLWALIAANLCSDVRVFSPKSVAIVSGLEKRSISDIARNKTRYFSQSKKIEDIAHIRKVIGEASVVHFAGPGKPWIEPIMGALGSTKLGTEANILTKLCFDDLPNFPLQEKFALYLRLMTQQIKS